MRPLDHKLKYQIDKLVRTAVTGSLGKADFALVAMNASTSDQIFNLALALYERYDLQDEISRRHVSQASVLYFC